MMTKAKLTVDPHQTPEETADLITRVAAAVSEATGSDPASVELEVETTEHVHLTNGVADRMLQGMRWIKACANPCGQPQGAPRAQETADYRSGSGLRFPPP